MKSLFASFVGYYCTSLHFLLDLKPLLDDTLVLFGIGNLALSMYFLIKKNKTNDTGKHEINTSGSSGNNRDRLTSHPDH